MVKAAAQPAALIAWMDSLGDSVRLRLLRLLERQELGVAELCDILQQPQSTMSRHLKVLSDQGWVKNRRQGTNHLYRTILDELDPSARRLWLLAREQTEDWPTTRQDQLRLERRLRDREGDSQSFFAGAAGQWDKLRDELYGSAFATAAMAALLPADYVVADLGCGTGAMTADLAQSIKQVIAVDNSPAMLKAARKRVEGLNNVDLRRGELEALPIEDGTCDAAILSLVLSYVAEPSLVLREMARILKPGGRGVIMDLLSHDRDDFRRQMGQSSLGFEPDDLQRMMSLAGLVSCNVRAIEPEPQARGPALFLATCVRGIPGQDEPEKTNNSK